MSPGEAAALESIFARSHITLKGRAKWALGIVTGNNKKFVQADPCQGYVAAFKGSDIGRDGLKSPSAFIPEDTSQYQQVAPLQMYKCHEKLIYKFISDRLVFFLDNQQRFVLNSANVVVPDSSFPISLKYLCDLLNGDFYNWIFRSVFSTHKVLRGDLESLPLFPELAIATDGYDEDSLLIHLGLKKQKNGTYSLKK